MSGQKLPAILSASKDLTPNTSTTIYPNVPDFGKDMPPNCPPLQAIVGPKLLFRLVRKENFDEADFRTTKEQGTFKNHDPCKRCSISTLENETAAKIMRKAIPNLANTKIASGVVPQEAGKLMNTPSTTTKYHWSWWPAASISRSIYFELVNETA